ncbi:MAG: hypothetical protein AB7Q29_12310 [Vicinamibacterales bacterium]
MEAPVLSYEICPSCGTEFGYTDSAPTDLARRQRHYALMLEWLRTGPSWYAQWQAPPAGWNGRRQLLQRWFATARGISDPPNKASERQLVEARPTSYGVPVVTVPNSTATA